MNKWDYRFIGLAELVSSWSKDPSTKVAAVIVDNNKRIISIGFNGYPQRIPDDDLHIRELKYAKIIHAEQNCLAFSNTDVTGYSLYCTHCPCSQCASMIIQRGITKVIFKKPEKEFYARWKESNRISMEMFMLAGVTVIEI